MRIAKAKDAASLIIYRREQGELEVLMGRRRKRASFAPNVYVFPGGTLESSDLKLSPPGPFNADGLAARVTPKIQGLAHAAIRETLEETGLLLGEKGRLDKSLHPTWEQLRHDGMVPSPRHLGYVGRAITPAESSTRFHARFFAAPFEHFTGSLIDEGELLDLRWLPVGKAASLPMYDVTEFMLEELLRFTKGPRNGTPFMSYRKNLTLIRYE